MCVCCWEARGNISMPLRLFMPVYAIVQARFFSAGRHWMEKAGLASAVCSSGAAAGSQGCARHFSTQTAFCRGPRTELLWKCAYGKHWLLISHFGWGFQCHVWLHIYHDMSWEQPCSLTTDFKPECHARTHAHASLCKMQLETKKMWTLKTLSPVRNLNMPLSATASTASAIGPFVFRASQWFFFQTFTLAQVSLHGLLSSWKKTTDQPGAVPVHTNMPRSSDTGPVPIPWREDMDKGEASF